MRKKYIFGKKFYFSIIASILVMVTMIATTFAWVGVFANSTFEQFDVNIRGSELREYGIRISLDGVNFKERIDSIDLKKAILLNWGYTESDLSSEKVIENIFSSIKMDQCTTLPVLNSDGTIKKLGQFYSVDEDDASVSVLTKKLFKFDLYVAPTKYYDGASLDSDFLLDVYLNTDAMTSTKRNSDLLKPVYMPADFINPYVSMIEENLMVLPDGARPLNGGESIYTATLDPSTATRVAFEKYEVKGINETYTNIDEPVSTVIYQNGYEYPVVLDEDEHYYDFGGILKDEYNLATTYFNQFERRFFTDHFKMMSIPNDFYSIRGVESQTKDVVLSNLTNHLIDPSKESGKEKIGLNQKMKMTVYFWFEGWDADCFKSIAGRSVSLSIKLSISQED